MSDNSKSFRKPTVLVVEDDDLVLQTVFNLVSAGGYKTLQSRNGDHASRLLAGNPDIGLLFTDIFLTGDMNGGMNGLDLARHAKEIRPDLAILLTSGFPPAALRTHGIAVESFPFIQKPYGASTILALIEKILRSDQKQK